MPADGCGIDRTMMKEMVVMRFRAPGLDIHRERRKVVAEKLCMGTPRSSQLLVMIWGKAGSNVKCIQPVRSWRRCRLAILRAG